MADQNHLDSSNPARLSGSSSFPVSLRIISGKSEHKLRPIVVDRFLIGAGSTCQLQLGAPNIPMVHSVIIKQPEGFRIHSLVSGPELRVNGHIIRSGALADGDVIEIAPYRFGFQQQNSPSPITLPFESESEAPATELLQEDMISDDEHEEEVDLEMLSASELVDLIEQEMQFVDEAEDHRREAAKNLFQEITSRADRMKAEQQTPEESLEVDEEYEILQTLAELSENLEDCQSQLNSAPWQDESHIRSLLSTQEKLLSRLDDAINWLQSTRDDGHKRSA